MAKKNVTEFHAVVFVLNRNPQMHHQLYFSSLFQYHSASGQASL